jgi:hypothetical protein
MTSKQRGGGRDVGELDERARRKDTCPLAEAGPDRHLHHDAIGAGRHHPHTHGGDDVAAALLHMAPPLLVPVVVEAGSQAFFVVGRRVLWLAHHQGLLGSLPTAE